MFDPLLWANANFRRLFAAMAATNLGDGVIAVALPWLATLLTQEAFLVGLVAAARQAPWFLLSLPAGVITDRYRHQGLLVAADLFRILLMLAVVLLVFLAEPGVAAVLVLALLSFLYGAAEVLRDNTAQTFLPEVVDKGRLERANSALMSTEMLAGQFLGPPLAGMLLGLALALPFGVMAAMLAFAVALNRPGFTGGWFVQ